MLPSLPALPTFCHYCRTESLAPQCITFLTLGILTPSPKATVHITSLIINSDFVNCSTMRCWSWLERPAWKVLINRLANTSFIQKCIFSQLSHKCTINFPKTATLLKKKGITAKQSKYLLTTWKWKQRRDVIARDKILSWKHLHRIMQRSPTKSRQHGRNPRHVANSELPRCNGAINKLVNAIAHDNRKGYFDTLTSRQKI